jgi:hypothetical protein
MASRKDKRGNRPLPLCGLCDGRAVQDASGKWVCSNACGWPSVPDKAKCLMCECQPGETTEHVCADCARMLSYADSVAAPGALIPGQRR